jgi:hypothetical protein
MVYHIAVIVTIHWSHHHTVSSHLFAYNYDGYWYYCTRVILVGITYFIILPTCRSSLKQATQISCRTSLQTTNRVNNFLPTLITSNHCFYGENIFQIWKIHNTKPFERVFVKLVYTAVVNCRVCKRITGFGYNFIRDFRVFNYNYMQF